MVGRIEGTLNARPWSCDARDNRVQLHFNSITGLRQSRRALRSIDTAFRTIPGFAQLTITLKAGPLPRITLAPNPSLIARLLGMG